MTTTPSNPTPDENDDGLPDPASKDGTPGAEVGMSEDGGSTFEPEEDPEGHS